MDVAEIRRRNLTALVDALVYRGATKRAAAFEFDLSPSFLSQLLGGKKMGDDVARKIETAYSLPHGFMDTLQVGPDQPANPWMLESHAPRYDADLLAASIRLVRKACENLDVEFDPGEPEDADIVLIACAYLTERKEQTVTVDNLVDFTKYLRRRISGAGNQEVAVTAPRRASGGARK